MPGLWILWVVAGVFMLFVGGIAVFLVVKALRCQARARQVSGTPLSRVKELDEGMAKVKGTLVAHDKLLRSPLSEKRCVYFHFLVEELQDRGGGKHSRSVWVTVIDHARQIDVSVDDGSGEVDLDLEGAEVVMEHTERKQTGTFRSPPARLERILKERYGQSSKGWLFNKMMRYTETVLEAGDRVVVVGEVEREPGRRPIFVRGSQPLLVSDKGSAGLARHYRRRIIGYWVGVAILGLVLLGIGVGAALLHGSISAPYDRIFAARGRQGLAPPPNPGPQPGPGRQPVIDPGLQPQPVPGAPGRTLNLLPIIDLSKDRVHGQWSVQNNVLICETMGGLPRLHVRYEPPAEYDFTVTFSQKSLRNGISLIMPKPGGEAFFWYLGNDHGSGYGFSATPKNVGGNLNGLVRAGRVYTTTVQVRKDGVRGLVDGKVLVEHRTDFHDLTRDAWRRMTDDRVLAVACDDPTVFNAIQITEVTGTGRVKR